MILSLIARRSLRAPRRAAGPARAARHARAVRPRARGRLHAVGRLDRRRPRRAARLLMPIEPCAEAPSIGSDERARAVPARPPAAPVRGARAGALPAGPHSGLGLHGPRPGGGRRRRRARARPRRRRRPAQPRARLPLRARRDARRRVPQLPRQGARARPSAATATCTSARRRDGVFPLVSMLGDLVPSSRARRSRSSGAASARVAMTFLGEGAFSVGDTHEGLNLAAVWQVPAVFVIQSNRYSYSTPVARQMVNTNIAQRDLRRLVDPRGARRRHRRARRPRRGARRRRAGPQRQRPAGGRGALGADARPRRARRLRATCRPGCARSSPSASTRSSASRRGCARRLRRRGDRRDARGGRGRGRSGPRRGRAGARAGPGDDRATASTPRRPLADPQTTRQQAAEHQVDQRPRASAPDPSRGRGGDDGRCGRRR